MAMPISLKKRNARKREGYGVVWLELPRKLIEAIDQHRERSAIKPSRTLWLHDAALAKLRGKR